LSQIDIRSFSFSSGGSFLNHVYFSFNKILTISEEGYRPLTPLARIITSSESVFGVLLGVILLSFVTTIIKEKLEGDLAKIIKELDYQAEEMRKILASEFNTSLDEMETQVKEKEPSVISEIEKIKPTISNS
jgi:hypothetical protein